MSEVKILPNTWTQGDHRTVTGTFKSGGSVVDVTGATVELIYQFKGRAPGKISGSVVSGAGGTFSAKFSSGIPQHGVMTFYMRLTDSGGDVFHSTKEYRVAVREKLLQAAS